MSGGVFQSLPMFSRAGGIKFLPPVDEATEDGYDEPFPLQTLVAPTVTGLPGYLSPSWVRASRREGSA